MKAAVTVRGVVMEIFCGVEVPARSPLNPRNWPPKFAAALIDSIAPVAYQPLGGLMLPLVVGLADVVR